MTALEKKDEEEKNIEIEKHWPQILAIIIGSMGGVTDGLLLSWTSPFIVKITNDKINYNINEEEASYFNVVQSIAMMISAPIFSKLIDKIGRKKTYMITAVTQSLSWILTAYAKNVYVFYLTRFFAGVSNACFFTVLPIYVGEVANPNVRGTWGNLVASSYFLGEWLINIIGSYFDIQMTAFICLTLPLLFFVLFSMMPESPYWYIMKGKEQEAKKSLKFLKRKQNIDSDYQQLKYDVERQLSETGTWSDLIKINSNRRALLAGGFLRFTQQSSGAHVFLVYTQLIFEKAGGNVSREVSSIIYTGLGVILNINVLLFVVNRFSRRVLYIVSLLSSGLALYILATYFYIDNYTQVNLTSVKWLPLTCLIYYAISISFGIYVIPTLMLSELFSARIKGKAMLILIISFGLGNVLSNIVYFYFDSLLGFHAPFYLFAVCNTVAAVFSYHIIPNTKGKTLEEIQQILKK